MKSYVIKQENKKALRKYELRLQSANFLVSANVFTFECPAFLLYIEVDLSRYQAPVIPAPFQLIKAVELVCEKGSLNSLALLPNVSFSMCADGYNINSDNEHIIYVNPCIDVYLNQFRKAYSVFYENFNPKNYLLIK